MPQSRMVFVTGMGARYTEAGTNQHVIAMKAHAFMKTLKKYQKHTNTTTEPFIPKPPQPLKSKIKKHEDTDAITAWDAVKSIFIDPNQHRIFKALNSADFNFLHASEKDARDFAVDYISQRNYKKLKSIKKLISSLRTLFRNIGREHSWADRADIIWNLETIGLSGNPITRATQDALIEDAKRRIKKKSRDTPIPITTTKQLNQVLAPAHHSAPISAPAAITLILYFATDIFNKITKYTPSKDSRRIVNLANMLALYTVLLHEAARPGDVTAHMTFSDIYFPLHTNISILSLAIMPPQTLAYIITNNLISHYVIASYKGKQAKLTLPRLKTLVPYPHNAFDLPSLIIFAIKCILYVSSALSNPPSDKALHIFKQNLNLSSLRHRKTQQSKTQKQQSLDASAFADLTFYSFRYAAAEEDKKYNINESWTRRRMGHSELSTTKDQYAANKDNRVRFNNSLLPLAPDIYPNRPTAPTIPLEMNPVSESGLLHNPNWIQTKLTIHDHTTLFNKAHELAEAYIAAPTTTTLTAITNFFKEHHTKPQDILPPLGFNFTFKDSMVTPDLTKLYDAAKETLTNTQSDTHLVTPEASIIPEIWSMPQILYGNFQKLLEGSIDYEPESEDLAQDLQEFQEDKQDSEQDPEDGTDTASTTSSSESWEDGFDLAHIQPSNHLVIYCAKPDRTSLKVEIEPTEHQQQTIHYVWIAKCINIQIKPNTNNKQAKLIAYLYFNKEKDPSKPLTIENKKTTMVIDERSVIDIYTDTSITNLEPDNIDHIKSFLQSHW